ncbi:putative polyketide synthase [Nemania serpens]|nr:putative polyketide synthase [Nemania serpens]
MKQQALPIVRAAVFCPQNKPPTTEYMTSIRRYLRGNPVLQPLEEAVQGLPDTWSLYAAANPGIAALESGSQWPLHMRDWLAHNVPLPIPEVLSGILALPLLTIIQVVQYFQYLDFQDLRHVDFLEQIQVGGAQGFCGGLLPAMAIAISEDETQVARNAAVAVCIALGIGAYGELGDEGNLTNPTTMVLRTKQHGQADKLVSKFPGAYISAVTDPFSISVVGSVQVLELLKINAEAEGFAVTKVNLRGKIHNPENRDICAELCRLCDQHAALQMPNSKDLQAPIRSNITGKRLSGESLVHEVIASTLVERCEWFNLMIAVSAGLKASGSGPELTFAMFGTGRKNCLPASPFEENGLNVTKLDIMTAVGAGMLPRHGQRMESYPEESIAIVGLAFRLPGASTVDELWDLLSAGKSMVEELPAQRLDGNKSFRAGLDGKRPGPKTWYGNFIENVDAFDNTFFGISPRESMHMDPQQRLLLETAYEALDCSGYLRHHRREDFDNVGCFVGTTYTEYLEAATAYSATAYSAPGTIRAFQTGKISYHFGWSGPSETIDTACSSSLVAINRACRAIQAGECRMALAGGVNIITGIHNFLDLGKAGFLSPTGQCKPFDEAADGYCRADGVGLVVLKPLRQAVTDGDNILGVIASTATNNGGLSPSITTPCPRAQTELFRNVVRRSGLEPRHISYVECHGPGTQAGDPVEVASVREVFGSSQRHDMVTLGSIKANVGHSETAAGIGSLIKVIVMLQQGAIPPLAGFKTLNPKIAALEPDQLQINQEVIPWDNPFRAALVSSYGAAGSNAALICIEPPRRDGNRAVESDFPFAFPVFVSGTSIESLRENVTKLGAYLRKTPPDDHNQLSIGNVAVTLHDHRRHHNIRWVGTAQSIDSLAYSLETSVDGEFFDVKPRRGRPVVLVFSGQSRQCVQLEKDWYNWFPQLRSDVDHCNRVLLNLGYPAILPVIFQAEAISDVVALQCATFAAQYACARSWIDAGLDVAAVVGHSFGELTAMVVSGILSLKDGLRLVASRASLIRDNWGPERGTMLAIHDTREVVNEVVGTVNSMTSAGSQALEIACYNSPRSQVIVGSAIQIQQAQEVLNSDARFHLVKHQRIDVSHGFHSVYTKPILEKLETVAKTLAFNDAAIYLEPGTEKPLERVTAGRIVDHARKPVYFDEAIARLEEQLGPSVWLEAGAYSPIISMTKKAVKNAAEHLFLPMRTKVNGNAVTSTTAALWQEGIDVSFWAFVAPSPYGLKPVWLPPYQFQRKRYWLDWIDQAHEQANTALKPSTVLESLPVTLVTPSGAVSNSRDSRMFSIHTKTNRFISVITAHAVRGLPLCPASMYMECVMIAAQFMRPGISTTALKFDDIVFQSALVLNHERDVSLVMDGHGDYLAWSFSFFSCSSRELKGRSTTHATGKFSFTSQTGLPLLERIMSDRVRVLLADPRAERLQTSRAYGLFSRIVNYSDCLRGISEIAIIDHEAVAEIRRPVVAVSKTESTAIRQCDAVSLDTFIQVVGLLINSNEACPENEVFLATGIDSILMDNCDFEAQDAWTVYAKISFESDVKVAGDMLVFSSAGNLIITASSVRFTRYPIVKLEKLLQSASSSSIQTIGSVRPLTQREMVDVAAVRPSFKAQTAPRSIDEQTLTSFQVPFGITGKADSTIQVLESELTPSDSTDEDLGIGVSVADERKGFTKTIGLEAKTPNPRAREQLMGLISDNSGAPVTNVEDGAILQDIGIDSLSIIELVSALEASFGLQFADDNIHLQSTISEILNYVQINTLGGGIDVQSVSY